MAGFALNNITNCYLGNSQVTAIYLGPDKIWPTTPPTPVNPDEAYLTFEPLGNATFTFTHGANNATIETSLDGTNWTTITSSGTSPITFSCPYGSKVHVKRSSPSYGIQEIIITDNLSTSGNTQGTFTCNWNYKVMGDVTSLCGTRTVGNCEFATLFKNSTNLIDASGLILPSNVTEGMCHEMFYGCTSLTSAPSLPATILNKLCYHAMFSRCTSLTSAPDLLATSLAAGCYEDMFELCSSLNYVKCLAISISATECTSMWLNQVASSGTFVKDEFKTWPTGDSGIPAGWTTENITPSSYTITISDPDQLLAQPIINTNGYQAGTSVSIDMGDTYDTYDGTEDDEYIFDITCSDPNLQFDFSYGEIETDEFGDIISSTNAHLDIQSMPSHNLTFTFMLAPNPEYDDGGGEEEGGDESDGGEE